MNKLLVFLICISFFSCSADPKLKSANQDFKSWAKTPPMGWNSYNSFGAAVTEKEVKENADYMAEKLKQYGWEYIVVDYCWSYPHPPGSIQDKQSGPGRR